MEAHGQTIAELLTGQKKFIIPYYQRAYVWDTPNWERFMQDMESVSRTRLPYFIGSIILKQKDTSSVEGIGNQRIVIDGQQRITTLAVFFKVLSLVKGNPEIFKLFRVQLDDEGKEWGEKISANKNDRPFFDKVIGLDTPKDLLTFKGGVYFDESGKEVKNPNRIIKLYQYLLNEIRLKADSLSYNIIQSYVLLVVIDVQNEDEQQIFDTINSQGAPLTTSELLKNYLFNENNVAAFNELWVTVFEKDAATIDYWKSEVVSGTKRPRLIDLFFLAFFMVKIHEDKYAVTTEDKLEYMRGVNLFESFKRFVRSQLNGDRSTLAREIHDAGIVFKDFFKPSIRYKSLAADNMPDRINEIIFSLDKATLIPYVFYVLLNADVEERTVVFEYVESYIMRRIVCGSDTRGYNKLFSDSLMTNHILTAKGLSDYIDDKEERLLSMPTDEDVRAGVEKNWRLNRQNTGLLYMLESKLRDSKSATQLFGLASYSLEHLMPKQWKLTWNMAGLSREAVSLRDELLWTLGNLAIIPIRLNTSVSNSTWQVKINGNSRGKGLKECAAGLVTLSKYLDSDEWSEYMIKARGEDLYEEIIRVWPSSTIIKSS